jgi:hypothetical protein
MDVVRLLTADRLRSVLSYDPETGVFTRDGREAGTVCKSPPRRKIFIDRRQYTAHRLAWMHVYGRWPVGDIDHIDGNALNNAFANLREVSRSVNMQNQRRARADNKSGFLGVHARGPGKYRAEITTPSGKKRLGTFSTPEEAHSAYLVAKRSLHEGCSI